MRWRVAGDVSRPMEQQIGHSRIITHWVAIFEGLVVPDRDWPGQFQLSWDNFRRKVTFANKVGEDVNVSYFHHSEDFPQTGLFFPKSAVDFRKYAPGPDLIRVNKSR